MLIRNFVEAFKMADAIQEGQSVTEACKMGKRIGLAPKDVIKSIAVVDTLTTGVGEIEIRRYVRGQPLVTQQL